MRCGTDSANKQGNVSEVVAMRYYCHRNKKFKVNNIITASSVQTNKC